MLWLWVVVRDVLFMLFGMCLVGWLVFSLTIPNETENSEA